jgi:hypothetical protein
MSNLLSTFRGWVCRHSFTAWAWFISAAVIFGVLKNIPWLRAEIFGKAVLWPFLLSPNTAKDDARWIACTGLAFYSLLTIMLLAYLERGHFPRILRLGNHLVAQVGHLPHMLRRILVWFLAWLAVLEVMLPKTWQDVRPDWDVEGWKADFEIILRVLLAFALIAFAIWLYTIPRTVARQGLLLDKDRLRLGRILGALILVTTVVLALWSYAAIRLQPAHLLLPNTLPSVAVLYVAFALMLFIGAGDAYQLDSQWSIRHNLHHFAQAYFMTILASAIGLTVLNLVPQVSHIFFQMPCPWPGVTGNELPQTLLFYAFVLLLLALYTHWLVILVPAAPDRKAQEIADQTAVGIMEQGVREVGQLPAADVLDQQPSRTKGWARVWRTLRHADLLVAVTRNRSAAPYCSRIGYGLLGGVLLLAVVNVALPHNKIWSDQKDGWLEVAFGTGYGVLLLLTGLWFALVPWWNDSSRPTRLQGGRMFGRALFILLAANLLGELLWFCARSGWLGYRYYTIWAMAHALFCLVMAARLCDALAELTHLPFRFLAGITAVLALTLLRPQLVGKPAVASVPAAPVAAAGAQDGPSAAALAEHLTDQWLTHLERRLNELDQPPFAGPAVFIAASGGGSRAAVFTALVYDELNQRRVDGSAGPGVRRTLADNVVLISSVSGGSLATAQYVNRRARSLLAGVYPDLYDGIEEQCPVVDGVPALRNSFPGQLKRNMRTQARILYELASAVPPEEQKDSDKRLIEELGNIVSAMQEGEDPQPADYVPWPILNSRFADEMCTDFMAPLLRGVLLPAVERGQRVAQFWEQTFDWRGITNHSGLQNLAKRDHPGHREFLQAKLPLVLFNASDMDAGTRLTAGFPAVPPGWIALRPSAESESPLKAPADIVDFDPAYEVSLAEAVRLSANFPWGFETALLTREIPATDPNGRPVTRLQELHVTDGGVVNNTGLDTLVILLRSLSIMASTALGPPEKEPSFAAQSAIRAFSILHRLSQRGVLVLEIDSGAKPHKPTAMAQLFPTVFKPVGAMENAGYNNDSLSRDHLYEKMGQVLGPATAFAHYRVQINHSEDIITAWALGPQDKAKIFTEFWAELKRIDPELRELLRSITSNQQATGYLWGRLADYIRRSGGKSEQQRKQIITALDRLSEVIAALPAPKDPKIRRAHVSEIQKVTQTYERFANEKEELFRGEMSRAPGRWKKQAIPAEQGEKPK